MTRRSIIPIVLCLIVLVVGMFLLKKAEKEKQIEPSKQVEETQKVVKPAEQPLPNQKAEPEPEKSKAELLPSVVINSQNIPHNLTVLMGMGEKKSYLARIREVKKLGKDLSEQEIQALYVLLNRKRGEDNLSLGELNGLKDSVAKLLEKQERKPEKLAHNLIAMYYDQDHDKVWRDYCVQHLGSFLPKVDDPAEKQKIADLFWEATEEKNLTIAGTSLIAMSHNLDDPLIDRDRVAAKALELSEDPKCGEPTKITALQICAKLDDKRVLPKAREIAVSRRSVPLRMSAIAAVGTLGDESDRAMLEKYARSGDIRLRKSAQSGLGRLGKR